MAKKRYTKKQYGGQSIFEMGLASYVRHLLDYTSGGGNWIVDGLKLPDNAHPTARWITNRIIHNYQKDLEGTASFGKRFEYSQEAVSFLEIILKNIKSKYNKDFLDSEEVEEGIYDRQAFDEHVDNALNIINRRIREMSVPRREKSEKVIVSPAELAIMVKEETQKLRDENLSDRITISKLQTENASYKRKETELDSRKAELDIREAKLNSKAKELKKSNNISKIAVANTDLTDTAVANTDVANTDLTDTDVANTDLTNTDVANTDVANTDVANTDVANTDLINTAVANTDANIAVANTDVANTDANIAVANTNNNTTKKRRNKTATIKVEEQKPEMTEEQKPDMTEEEKAKAEKEKSIALKRAEIMANLEKVKQQQQEKEFIEFLEKRQKKPKTRDEIIEELPNDLPDLTEGEIQKWGEKLNFYDKDDNDNVITDEEGKKIVNKTCVNIYLNISRLSSDPDNIRFLGDLFSKKILNVDCKHTLKKLVSDLIIDEKNGLIDIAKTTEIYISNLWLTPIWNVKPELTNIDEIREAVDNDKITNFLDSVKLIRDLFTDLQIFKKNNNKEIEPENDKNIYIIISQYLEKVVYNLMINRIGYSWGNFGTMFALDNINYAKFLRIIESYEKKTKYNLKSIYKFLSIITLLDGEQYKLFFKQCENSIKAIEPIFDSIYECFLNKTTPIPDIRVLGDIYSNFLQKSSEYLMFLILYAYKEKKEFSMMENIRKKILQIINEWETKMNEKEKVEHLAYINVCKTFGGVIQKLLDYSSIPDEIKVKIGFPLSQPPGGGLPQPQPPGGGLPQPPGGGFTKTIGKNTKKGGRRRRTQKKRYRK